jgi:hypothetical protein
LGLRDAARTAREELARECSEPAAPKSAVHATAASSAAPVEPPAAAASDAGASAAPSFFADISEDTSCPVCLDSVGEAGGLVAELQCGHRYCLECVADTLLRRERGSRRSQTHSCLLCKAPCLKAAEARRGEAPLSAERVARAEQLAHMRRSLMPSFTTLVYPAALPAAEPVVEAPAAAPAATASTPLSDAPSANPTEANDDCSRFEIAHPTTKVGKWSSTTTLDEVAASLQLPLGEDESATLDGLQGALPYSARKLHLPRMSEAEQREVKQAQLADSDLQERPILSCDGVEVDNVPLRRSDFARLRTSQQKSAQRLPDVALYLNDEVINAWGGCVRLSGFKVHVFSTLVTSCLWQYHSKPTTVEYLRRTLRKLNKVWPQGLLKLDAWVLPKHRGLHWTGAVIHFGAKRIVFADSLGSKDPDFCRRLWCLLEVASHVLEQCSFDFSRWSWGSLGRLAPRQPTPYDCGIFAAVLLVTPPEPVMHQWPSCHIAT